MVFDGDDTRGQTRRDGSDVGVWMMLFVYPIIEFVFFLSHMVNKPMKAHVVMWQLGKISCAYILTVEHILHGRMYGWMDG